MITKYAVGDVLRLGNELISTDLQVTEIKFFPPRILYKFKVVAGEFPFPTAAYFQGELDRMGVVKCSL